MINSRDTEPWAYGEEVEQISRNYIKFRYQLLPYIYSLFHDASQTGLPVQRSLAIDYPHNHRCMTANFRINISWDLTSSSRRWKAIRQFVRVYFPPGEWYSLYNGHRYGGDAEVILDCPIRKLPVFVKGGALIPMQPSKSHTKQPSDTLILHVYKGESSSLLFMRMMEKRLIISKVNMPKGSLIQRRQSGSAAAVR